MPKQLDKMTNCCPNCDSQEYYKSEAEVDDENPGMIVLGFCCPDCETTWMEWFQFTTGKVTN